MVGIYSVAMDVIAIDNDVALVDPHPKDDAKSFGNVLATPGYPPLNVNRHLYGIDDTGKLHFEA